MVFKLLFSFYERVFNVTVGIWYLFQLLLKLFITKAAEYRQEKEAFFKL